MNRPKCFEFAMDFLGTPEDAEVTAYITYLERVIHYADIAILHPTPENCAMYYMQKRTPEVKK